MVYKTRLTQQMRDPEKLEADLAIYCEEGFIFIPCVARREKQAND